MKKLFFLFIIAVVFSCTNNTADKPVEVADNRIALRTDTLNTIKLTDTMVIFESTCRGCAYENSTSFAVADSMNIVKLADIITTDNNPAGMTGGSISKDLILASVKTGITNIKVYKFWSDKRTAEDSTRFDTYQIAVKQ